MIKEQFVEETTRKKIALENLLYQVQQSKMEIERGMNGSASSDIIYNDFDELIKKLQNSINACNNSISEYSI